jgi:hypothetical protein
MHLEALDDFPRFLTFKYIEYALFPCLRKWSLVDIPILSKRQSKSNASKGSCPWSTPAFLHESKHQWWSILTISWDISFKNLVSATHYCAHCQRILDWFIADSLAGASMFVQASIKYQPLEISFGVHDFKGTHSHCFILFLKLWNLGMEDINGCELVLVEYLEIWWDPLTINGWSRSLPARTFEMQRCPCWGSVHLAIDPGSVLKDVMGYI